MALCPPQGVPVPCTLTGVKHLHHKAVEFDVGIYFESNGHGTVIFSDRAIETFKMAAEDQRSSEVARNASLQLLALTQLINQAVGDAISDLLLVEVILLQRGVCSVLFQSRAMSLNSDLHYSGDVVSGMSCIERYLAGS